MRRIYKKFEKKSGKINKKKKNWPNFVMQCGYT